MKTVCENIDRLITTEMRLTSLVRGTTSSLYNKAREATQNPDYSITYQIANDFKERIDKNNKFRIGIFTGVWHPEHLPDGENDGPIGAVVLAKALHDCGAEIVIGTEKEVYKVIKELCVYLNLPAKIISLSRENENENKKISDEIDSAIFIEKIGPSKEGIYHFATGYSREEQDAPLESMLEEMQKEGKLTVGIGDMGNEIGFGKIYKSVRKINPLGEVCNCPQKDGITTIMSTDYILPSSVSNIGAYGIVASLALLSKDTSILHEPENELELIKICTKFNCIDGGFGKAHNYVDGISSESMFSYVQILKDMVRTYFNTEKRKF